jgi:hypothetical protein
MELVFQGSMYSSTRYRAGMVHAKAVSAFIVTRWSRCRGLDTAGTPRARRGAAGRQVPKPQADRAHGLVELGLADGERKSLPFGELAALPADPLQGLLGGGVGG